MKVITFFKNARWFLIPLGTMALCSICLSLAPPAQAQRRNPDLILTVKKDTLSVRIVEVGISDMKYKQLTGDTIATYTVAKAEVVKVFYGNGDEEEFKPSPSLHPAAIDRRYYKMMVRSPFQKEIAQWPTEKLIAEKELYKQKYIPQKVGGIMAFPIGGILFFFGAGQAFSASFSRYRSGSEGKAAIVSGLVITCSGIPLSIFGSKNGKKYRAIKTELEIRESDQRQAH